ncbi:zf-HC2 domain-containing protein [uncultured Gimesia sp.]|uniref:zf-HC2 domain-containing protein n=1 Tax=uncultured Gimesia sp. TaxID=1678688 RepID=UPI00260FFC61|nr:zf-HC2 domain-containing protein [uncultured Gimesia sp.]
MRTCKEVSKLISESLDRKLPLRQRIALKMHLVLCRFCRRFRKDLQYIRGHIRQQTDDVSIYEEKLSDIARDRIQRLLDSES